MTLPDASWYSTIAYLAVETFQTAGMSDETFYQTVAEIPSFLNDLVPAWVTFDWFRDGPSGAGFFLDQDFNLDNQRLTAS